jgi:hypothetical protein
MDPGRRVGGWSQEEIGMCLTCGCMQAHLEMGDNVTYEDLKRMADGNGKTVDETLDIIRQTAEVDRREHELEYGEARPAS